MKGYTIWSLLLLLRNKKRGQRLLPELLEPPRLLSTPGLGPRADPQGCPPAPARCQGAGSPQKGGRTQKVRGTPTSKGHTVPHVQVEKPGARARHLVLQKPIPEENVYGKIPSVLPKKKKTQPAAGRMKSSTRSMIMLKTFQKH